MTEEQPMGNRTIERAVARKLYGDFTRAWRREKRLAGKYGEPGFRRPTFAQWYAMHQRNQEMMAESTPQDVQEYLGLDPWTDQPKELRPVESEGDDTDRGVMTIPISGDE